MKKKIAILLISTFVCIGLVMSFMYFTGVKTNKSKNGFNRKIVPLQINVETEVKLADNSYYVCGATKGGVYIANQNGNGILSYDGGLKEGKVIPMDRSLIQGRFKVIVDSPFIYIGLIDSSRIVVSNFSAPTVYKPFVSDFRFSTFRIISPSAAVTRHYSTELRQNDLYRVGPEFWGPNDSTILRKQVDGIFCIDGMLSFDKVANIGTYVYYYRNEVIAFDSSMKIIKNFHTIDTTFHAKLKIEKVGNETTTSAPPQMVNGPSFIHKNYLFVNSRLTGDNEDPASASSKKYTFDIYEIRSGTYIGSFYLPYFKDRKPSSLLADSESLFAIHGSYLVKYDFRPINSILKN